MSDTMKVQPFEKLLSWILSEFQQHQSIFGIHRSLFYTPPADPPYAIKDLYGHYLTTPIGPGAGPHTQLTQNILCAWLTGGRFIELKTVQIMDELEIPRPCIDMEDEGYNVEWSQELKLDQSLDEYVKAWVLIFVLRRLLELEGNVPFGTIFNMSVGYNLEGIQSPPMTRFMDQLTDASQAIQPLQALLKERYPAFADLEIPTQITNSVTLSTMHGCPPDEIERIGRYLLEERGLHTTVKLNPTLLGKERVLGILHDDLGFEEIHIPDPVFEHDLKYERAVTLIRTLKSSAAEKGLTFGVKLSNTLAMANHRDTLPGDEMYMSGRALYPITINLFHTLSQAFDGDLNVSFSAGADSLNVTQILAAGGYPITTVSDLLKPGGYGRLGQYLENLDKAMAEQGAASLEELAQNKQTNLEQAAGQALQAPRYKKNYHPHGLPKVPTRLDRFDCIAAPCVVQCPVHQDVPEYAGLIAQGEYDRALAVILSRNPLPGVTGTICTHVCQTRCTRNNYDEPVAIRALKRVAAEKGQVEIQKPKAKPYKAAVIGSGPAGLSTAYYLALNGIQVTVFEAKNRAGGMLAIAPTFRLPEAIVQADIDRIKGLGVQIQTSHPITTPPETLLEEGFDAVAIGSGAQGDAQLGIEGEDGDGVHHVLNFLDRVRQGERIELGQRVLVIGGGNSAMDAARTAQRLTGGPVSLVYRRTRQEMPADAEEIEDALDEGIELQELVSPTRIILENGQVSALECVRNELGEPGPDGRRRPVAVPDSTFQITADAVLIAIGQRPNIAFLDGSSITLRENGTIKADPQTGQAGADRIYAGGDAVRGPATIIEACADGRRAAEAICQKLGIPFERPAVELPQLSEAEILQAKQARTRKEPQHKGEKLEVGQRQGFDLVDAALTEQAAQAEALRCVQCASLCDKCVEVCPNRANYAYTIEPVHWTLDQLSFQDGAHTVVGQQEFRVEQRRQILHVDDLCNECGNCATFCVHDGHPYTDKPRLFLDKSEFDQTDENAFYIERVDNAWVIRAKEKGVETSLLVTDENGAMVLETPTLRLEMSADSQIGDVTLKAPFQGIFSLHQMAEMAVLLRGVVTNLGFLIEG